MGSSRLSAAASWTANRKVACVGSSNMHFFFSLVFWLVSGRVVGGGLSRLG